MHDIDRQLKLQLEGKHAEARIICDNLEALGKDKILDAEGKNTQDIWMRHSFNRGWFLIQEGKYQEGCQLLENGRYLNVYGSPPLKTDAPIFNPNQHNIIGKSIIVSLEGGYGDEIIHARFATSFKKMGAKAVYIASAPELVSVFSRIEGVDKVILRNEAHTVPHDFWVPGFSAGWIAGHTFEDFPGKPYLTAIPESVRQWKNFVKAPEGKKKVGIRWAGNPKFEHQQFRKFPVEFITNLTKYSDSLELFSFQKDHNTIDLPEGIHDLQHFLLSWEDTAAAIMNLDLMITSCTSIAHISAALGVETWVVVPCLPYHTWTFGAPESTTSPYYECVRLFRQTTQSKWNDTWQNLYAALEEKFGLEHVEMPNEDKEPKKLNLGCGLKKFDGFLNVDSLAVVQPDEVVDLNTTPWPWKDSEFSHIVAKDILEHLGETKNNLINIIKEMYRVSTHGAIWEIQVPHWRCDIALDDPTHRHLITLGFFKMFDQKRCFEKIQGNEADSILAYEHDVDIEVCDTNFEYTDPWKQKILDKKVSQDELGFALNHFNNVALSMRVLIQVHKQGRYSKAEFEAALAKAASKVS